MDEVKTLVSGMIENTSTPTPPVGIDTTGADPPGTSTLRTCSGHVKDVLIGCHRVLLTQGKMASVYVD